MNPGAALEVVGMWVGERSAQATLLVALLAVGQFLGRHRLPPRWSHALWLLPVGLLLLPMRPESPVSIDQWTPRAETFWPELAAPRAALIALPIRQDFSPVSANVPADDSARSDNPPLASAGDGSRALVLSWAIVAALLLVGRAAGDVRFRLQLRTSGRLSLPPAQAAMDACRRELGMRRRVALVETRLVACPAALGFFRPRVLVPPGFGLSLSPEEMRFVFLHELTHVRRGDLFVEAAVAGLQALHWFNPVLWWAFRRLRAERELACDAAVLHHAGENRRGRYGEAILRWTHDLPARTPVSSVVGILEDRRILKRRIEQIARFSRRSRASSALGVGLLLTIAAVFLTAAKPTPKIASALPALGADEARICDRHGVVLAEGRLRPDGRVAFRYPLGALAAQVLTNLDAAALPRAGETLYLTLDVRLQRVAEQALREVGRGAVVLLDPKNGDILAMASVPSFDPNDAKQKQMLADPTEPRRNRAISALVPGSVFLPVTALALISAGMGEQTFPCNGGVSLGNIYMKCWISDKGDHGTLALAEATAVSCNSYFYRAGIALGGERLEAAAKRCGFGTTTGIPLRGEQSGVADGPENLRRRNPDDQWRDGFSANAAIGQGAVSATPLQIAGMIAAVGNGGTLYWPRLVERVTRPGRADQVQPAGRVRARFSEDLTPLRAALWKTVNGDAGTARRARVAGLDIAGRIGSAQQWRIQDDQKIADSTTWFAGYAPANDPRAAIAVMVQGAKSGGSVPAPLAGRIFKAVENSAAVVETSPMRPAAGDFRFRETISTAAAE